MLTETGRRRSVEVDYERDPFTDHEIIRGIDRRIGEDYGLGAADLAGYILEYFADQEDKAAAHEGIFGVCEDVIYNHRYARLLLFEEGLGVRESHHQEARVKSSEKRKARVSVEFR